MQLTAQAQHSFKGVLCNQRRAVAVHAHSETLFCCTLPCCISRIVDGNWGMGVSVPKYVFQTGGKKARYTPNVICGSSVPL